MITMESSARQSTAGFDQATLLDVWRHALVGSSRSEPMEVAVEELAAYFNLPKDEVIRRCVDWEQDSLQEWKAKDRTSIEGLSDFYKTQTSWIFDTMRYHAEQANGDKQAESVQVAAGFFEWFPNWKPGYHLDFGAGPGTSSLFFAELGWSVSLADISTTFLDFARWRLARHEVDADFYDMNADTLPAEKFDLITALDVMVHVPNVGDALDTLNRALKPGGFLVFNIDNRPPTEENHGHLYSEQFPILRQVRKHGFARSPKIAYFHVFQKVRRSKLGALSVAVADSLRYNFIVSLGGKVARGARLQK